MDKPVLRVYGTIVFSLLLVVQFAPSNAPRFSRWTEERLIRVKLLAYRYSSVQAQDPRTKDMGTVVIIMDDGWETQYSQGYKKLREHGLKACVAVIPALVDQYEYMTYRQLASLYLDGWDLLNHTYSHLDLLTLSEAEQRRELVKARTWLHRHFFQRGSNIIVYPMGRAPSQLAPILAEEGFIAARDLSGIWITGEDAPRAGVEVCNLISSITFPEVEAAVEGAIASASTLVLILHKIERVTVNTQMQLAPDLFGRIIDYLIEREDCVRVVTLTELLVKD